PPGKRRDKNCYLWVGQRQWQLKRPGPEDEPRPEDGSTAVPDYRGKRTTTARSLPPLRPPTDNGGRCEGGHLRASVRHTSNLRKASGMPRPGGSCTCRRGGTPL